MIQKTEEDIIKERIINSIKERIDRYNITDKENLINDLGKIFYIQIKNIKELAYQKAKIETLDISKNLNLEEKRIISFNIKANSNFKLEDGVGNNILPHNKINVLDNEIKKDTDIEMIISNNRSQNDNIIDIDMDNNIQYEGNKKANTGKKLPKEQKGNFTNIRNENGQNFNFSNFEIKNNSKEQNYAILKAQTGKEVKALYEKLNEDTEILDLSLYQDNRKSYSPEYYIFIEYNNINVKKRYKANFLDFYFYDKKEYIKVLKLKGAIHIDIEDI